MTPPLVSVVMPVRNEEESVLDALASVLTQTHAHLEVLVVDGRSEDRTRERVAAVARADPRVRLIDNPARGISAALNLGLAAAAGDVFARVDGHATVSDAYVERGLAVLDTRPEVAAVGGRRLGVASTAQGRAIALALSSRFGVGNSLNHYLLEPTDTDHASFPVYRTAVLRSVGGWDEELPANEDVDLDHRVQLRGHAIAYDPEMIIFWRVRERVVDLARQYRRYGRGKAAMIRKNGTDAIALRHLAPPCLVGVLAAALALAATHHPVPAALVGGPYALGLLGGVALTWNGRPAGHTVSLPALPGAFAAMHLAWGVGFIEGFAGMAAADGSLPRRPTRAERALRP